MQLWFRSDLAVWLCAADPAPACSTVICLSPFFGAICERPEIAGQSHLLFERAVFGCDSCTAGALAIGSSVAPCWAPRYPGHRLLQQWLAGVQRPAGDGQG